MTDLELRWSPSPHYRRLMTVAVIATIAAVISGRAPLMLLAGPPMVILLIAAGHRPGLSGLKVRATVTPDRCVEGEEVRLDVEAHADLITGQITLSIVPTAALREIGPGRAGRDRAVRARRTPFVAIDTDRLAASWTLGVVRWGRWTAATVSVNVRDRGRPWQARAACPVGEVIAYPQPAALRRLVIPRARDAVLGVRRDDSVVAPSIDRVPRTALPVAALVVLFSPLLDERTIDTLQDLRDRGTTLVVVDVLTVEPPRPRRPSEFDDVVLRLWRLDRAAQRYRLAESGTTVVQWDGRRALDEVLPTPDAGMLR